MRFLIPTLVTAVLLGGAAHAIAQEQPAQPESPQTQQLSMQDLLKMAEQIAAPVEQHQRLGQLAGDWTVQGKFFFMPGQPPIEFTGTSSNRMILGGRFLQLEGEFNSKEPAMTVQSLTVYGYDKRVGKYTTWGADTFGTYTVSAEGGYDEASKSITFAGQVEEPGGARLPFKFVLTFVDDSHYGLELHMEYPGLGWQKQMEAMHEKK